MRIRFQLLLVSAIVLAVYYPSIFAGFSPIDDMDMVHSWEAARAFSLKKLFFPGGGGLYYRPLLGLSFHFDKYAWGLESGMMHLENILMHLCNALLVFFLSREMLAPEERDGSWLPLITSLFFALHPANVESVSWVSGRTDPLACIFVLAGAIALVRYGTTHRFRYIPAAAALLFLGAVTKESAVGFLLGGVLLICTRRDAAQVEDSGDRVLRVVVGVVAVCGIIALFFLLRSFAYSSNKGNIATTFTCWRVSPGYSCQLVLRAFGFYLKKIFWPFPLNFAITEVDPMYELYALPAVALSLVIAWRRTRLSALYFAGWGLIAPAFVIVFGQIAWTPFAERYLYMGSAFIITAAVHYVSGLFKGWDREPVRFIYAGSGTDDPKAILITGTALCRVMLPFLLAVALYGTGSRARLWSSTLALTADSARKSPESREMRGTYAVALYQAGDRQGAEREMAAASTIENFIYDERYDLNYASLLREIGKHAEARRVLGKVFRKTKGKSLAAWEEQLQLLRSELTVAPEGERDDLRRWVVVCCDRMYALNPEPSKLYLLGQTALALKEKQRALHYFDGALRKMSADDPNRALTARLVTRLQGAAL